MRRRRLIISVGLVVTFVALVLVGLGVMVKRVPGFYAQAEMPADSDRIALSRATTAQWLDIASFLRTREPGWEVTFTADQLNAYLQQDYYLHGGDNNLGEGFSSPRVKIEDGKMRIGVRYGSGITSTVLSLEVRVWLVENEVNLLAMEIVSLQAGSLPLSTGTLLDYISEAARRENIDITWYRHEGHPVAVMRFQSDLTRPTFQFDRVDLRDGKLTIAARSTDPLGGGPPPPRVVSNTGP
ncbi:MAG: hypothetical protein J2P46_20860 [Zavarzinella sp.]|nr:hypothetical protein [Zavarzinella sp.]